MKAKIQGYEVECSVDEFKQFVGPVKRKYKSRGIQKNNSDIKKIGRTIRHIKHWSSEDLVILKEGYGDKKNISVKGGFIKRKAMRKLVRKLRRTPQSVSNKAMLLGLTSTKKKNS